MLLTQTFNINNFRLTGELKLETDKDKTKRISERVSEMIKENKF
jgi:hypothetical protein